MFWSQLLDVSARNQKDEKAKRNTTFGATLQLNGWFGMRGVMTVREKRGNVDS